MSNFNNVFSTILSCYCNPEKTDISYNKVWYRCDSTCGKMNQGSMKLLSLTQPPNYLGTSQKMLYGSNCRTVPGLTTFANKKVQDKTVKPTYIQQPACTHLGKERDAQRLNCQLSSIHPRVAKKMQCVNTRTCRINDFTPLRPTITKYTNNLPPFKMY